MQLSQSSLSYHCPYDHPSTVSRGFGFRRTLEPSVCTAAQSSCIIFISFLGVLFCPLCLFLCHNVCLYRCNHRPPTTCLLCHNRQELSYRKQIARQLRTQYVEGMYRPKYKTVTLKSRLRVTQGHWKRNRSIDHTRLTISRDI